MITTKEYSVSGTVNANASYENTQDAAWSGYTAIGVMSVVSYSSWVLPYATYLNGETLTIRVKNIGSTSNTVSIKCLVLYVKN